jgi:hypothetical protein
MKRGQSSVEFLLLFGSLFFIFIMILSVFYYYNKIQYRNRDYESLEDLAHMIDMELVLAANVEDGYERTFEIPGKIGARDYTLECVNRDLTVKLGEYEYSLIVPDFTGNLSKGKNTISKQGGIVYIG